MSECSSATVCSGWLHRYTYMVVMSFNWTRMLSSPTETPCMQERKKNYDDVSFAINGASSAGRLGQSGKLDEGNASPDASGKLCNV